MRIVLALLLAMPLALPAHVNYQNLPPHARQVEFFFDSLEEHSEHIPNILDMPEDDFNLRVESLALSTSRIIELLQENPKPVAQKFVTRFFKMYACIAHKRIDRTYLKKKDQYTLWRHELVHLHRTINRFTTDLEKALMRVSRSEFLTLQIAYDMTVVNTFFKQLFPPAAFPRASQAKEFAFKSRHSASFQKKLIACVTALAAGVGGIFVFNALLRKKVAAALPPPLSQIAKDQLAEFAFDANNPQAAHAGLRNIEAFIKRNAPWSTYTPQQLDDLTDVMVKNLLSHANGLRLLMKNATPPDPHSVMICKKLDAMFLANSESLAITASPAMQRTLQPDKPLSAQKPLPSTTGPSTHEPLSIVIPEQQRLSHLRQSSSGSATPQPVRSNRKAASSPPPPIPFSYAATPPLPRPSPPRAAQPQRRLQSVAQRALAGAPPGSPPRPGAGRRAKNPPKKRQWGDISQQDKSSE